MITLPAIRKQMAIMGLEMWVVVNDFGEVMRTVTCKGGEHYPAFLRRQDAEKYAEELASVPLNVHHGNTYHVIGLRR